MDRPDEENLLPRGDASSGSSPTIGLKFNGIYQQYSQRSQVRKNLSLLVTSVIIASCLTIYFYLNYIAINDSGSSGVADEQPNLVHRYKPLSRRKPILDHESIFSESGPSLLKLSDLMAHCIVALQIGGRKVVELSLRNNPKLAQVGSKGKTKEGADDVVTGADITSHEAILNTIRDSYRRLKIVSEEDTTSAFEDLKMEVDILPINRGIFANMLRDNLLDIEGQHSEISNWPLIDQQHTLVWVDPLDATKEYSENLTEYVTLMACIVHKSTPIAGIIHRPFSNETIWSLKDISKQRIVHSRDLTRIWSANDHHKKYDTNEQLRITVSRSHAGDVENALRGVYGNRVEIVPAGGSGFKTLQLVRGNVSAYVHVTHIKKWDICAPHAILNSLPGARMTDLNGQSIAFDDARNKIVTSGLIATLNEGTHNELIDSLRNYTRQA